MTEVKCNVCGKKMDYKSNTGKQFFEFPLKKKKGEDRVLTAWVEVTFNEHHLFLGSYGSPLETDVCRDCQDGFLKKMIKKTIKSADGAS